MMDRPFKLLSLAALGGCGEMTIQGMLVDGQGSAIPDAMVTVKETTCATTSDTKGHFKLACKTGSHTLVMSKQGHLSEQLSIDAPNKEPYSSGRHVLAKLPEQEGLFVFTKKVARLLQPGHLIREHQGKGMKKTRAYCLDKATSQPNKLSAGMTPFLDYQAKTWRPFQLDAAGCAYRDSRNERGSWVVEYREKPDFDETKLSDTMKIARIPLEPGEYFIADWKGFFQASKDSENMYGGYWLTVGH